MENTREAVVRKQGGKRATEKQSKKSLAIIGIIVLLLAGAYLAVCAIAAGSNTVYPNYTVNRIKVGGLKLDEAAKKLSQELPQNTVDVYLSDDDKTAVATVSYADLGITESSNYNDMAQKAYDSCRSGNFLSNGTRYIQSLFGGENTFSQLDIDETQFNTKVTALVGQFAIPKVDGTYSFDADNSKIVVTMGTDGRIVDPAELSSALKEALSSADVSSVTVTAGVDAATNPTAQSIAESVSAEMKNAGYDKTTGSITPEKVGATFDAASAQELLDGAKAGETVDIPATIQYPTVTAEKLKPVLFRDVLGTYTTHVGGSSARINNVKLATSAVNGTVLNSGDVFSYNGTVGQRTAAKGYQAAPAYVQGETVNEIGGGVCQPSSTLYMATLLSNLEIVKRAAHRYVPSYMPKGMDATVSWGGPDYQFRNNTDYPIKISAVYSGGKLTMTLYGTNVTGNYVKMTNKVLSTTAYQVVKQDDPSMAAGTQKTKTSPYTGYKVESYRNVYSSSGTLISSKMEAVSDYKVRNQVILVGTKKAAATTETPATTPSTGTGSSSTNTGGSTGSTSAGGATTGGSTGSTSAGGANTGGSTGSTSAGGATTGTTTGETSNGTTAETTSPASGATDAAATPAA